MSWEMALEHVKRALRKTFEFNPSGGWKEPLYIVTLVVQAPAVLARWALGYVVLWIVGLDLVVGRDNAAALFALAPLIWSLSAFWFPGSGWLWHRARGAREPSGMEGERYSGVLDELGDEAWEIADSVEMVVVDHPDFFAYGRGITYAISRGLLESPYAKPVTGHELNHFRSDAARLSQALERLVWWRDPYRWLAEKALGQKFLVRVFYFLWRWFFRVAGGGLVLEHGPLQRAWAASFRKEEEAADAFAVQLGQGLSLARYLKLYELPRERPRRRGLFDHMLHPFLAYRIDALRRMSLEGEEGEDI